MYKKTIFNINNNNNSITYYGPEKCKNVKINAILLGDSWVDCLWNPMIETWPVKLCVKKEWTYINIAKAGTTVADIKEQIALLNKFADYYNVLINKNTLWIMHSGGNDVLFNLFLNFNKVLYDIFKMYSLKLYDNVNIVKSQSNTFIPNIAKNISLSTYEIIDIINNTYAPKKIFVSSNTISNAMPFTFLVTCFIAPFYTHYIIDTIALLCSLYLTCELNNFQNKNKKNLNIIFFQEDKAIIKHKNNISWCKDGFHPTNLGHEYIMNEAILSLDENKSIYSIYKEKNNELSSLYNNQNSLFTKLSIIVNVVLLFIIGFFIMSIIMIVKCIYFITHPTFF